MLYGDVLLGWRFYWDGFFCLGISGFIVRLNRSYCRLAYVYA